MNRRDLLFAGAGAFLMSGCDLSEGIAAGAEWSDRGYSPTLKPVLSGEWERLQLSGKGVKIGVLDSGFGGMRGRSSTRELHVAEFSDFVAKDTATFFSDQANHGTLMCEAIGGRADQHVYGLANEAIFYLAKGEDEKNEPRIDEIRAIEALNWLIAKNVDVINISIGFTTFDDTSPYTPDDLFQKKALLSVALERHLSANPNLIAVVSAGNSGREPWKAVTIPGDVGEALTVGSVEKDLKTKRPSSGTGPTNRSIVKPDLCMPSGRGASSVATAAVTGLVACLKQAKPKATRAEILEAIRRTATNSNAPNQMIGFGVPRPEKAFHALSNAASVSPASK